MNKILHDNLFDFFLSYFIVRKKISIKIIIFQDDRYNDNIDTDRVD